MSFNSNEMMRRVPVDERVCVEGEVVVCDKCLVRAACSKSCSERSDQYFRYIEWIVRNPTLNIRRWDSSRKKPERGGKTGEKNW